MTKKDATLTVVSAPPTERVPDGDEVTTGQWYWHEDDEDKEKGNKWLVCVSEVGSNYFEVTRVARYGGSWRIKIEEFDKYCTRETNPEIYIAAQIDKHQNNVRTLLDEIRRVTAQLGVTPRDALNSPGQGESTALSVAHGTADINAHKQALIKAQKETLPELFKQVESEHEMLAVWMKANLIPMKSDLEKMKGSIQVIEDRIFTVELYAGLTEQLVLIQDGEPAHNDTKVSLFQRRHYMDEECLANYEAGGMDYRSIDAFDQWLLRRENLNRILPKDRCAVAFRIRRFTKARHGKTLGEFIRIMSEEQADKWTYLYIRNGKKVFRMRTGIDFGEQMFPDKDRSTLLGGGNIYIDTKAHSKTPDVISQKEYDVWKEEVAERWAKYNSLKARYDALSPADKKQSFKILGQHVWEPSESKHYELCTPDNLYYDDAMRQIARAATEHNRIAVVLQGLLDRSIAFHPHPPWRLWTMEGFSAGIDLIYDDSKAIASGDAPDFKAYMDQLGKSIKRGSLTIGQEYLWAHKMAEKEMDRRDRSWRSHRDYDMDTYFPYGNPGPGFIAPVVSIGRNGTCRFVWERERATIKWIRDHDNPGYMKADDSTLTTDFTCPASELFNVSAYTPGDYKLFFSDPRTRAGYLEWAPYMLAAEDHYAGKSKKKKRG